LNDFEMLHLKLFCVS